MNSGEWKVSIYREPWNDALHVMLSTYQNGKLYRAKPVEFELVEHKDYESAKATLQFNGHDSSAILRAFAEALDGYGVKTDHDATITGTLKAQTAHLHDLRQLLKLK